MKVSPVAKATIVSQTTSWGGISSLQAVLLVQKTNGE